MIGRRLTMRAHVERNQAIAKDGWGQAVAPVFQPLAIVNCFAWSPSGQLVVDGKKTAVVQGTRIMFALGEDVAEGDQIARITDARGTVLFPGRMRIDGPVQFKHNHNEAALVRVG